MIKVWRQKRYMFFKRFWYTVAEKNGNAVLRDDPKRLLKINGFAMNLGSHSYWIIFRRYRKYL